jgi:hypothetical protein
VLAAGTAATLAGFGSALLACADELPLAVGLLGLAALGGGVVLWRRRAKRSAQAVSGCAGGCNANR